MKFKNSQEDVEFNIDPKHIKTILIKLSGGIDSALTFICCASL